jgi:hypothetical protein
MYSILYLPEAVYVRDVYGAKKISTYLIWHEANVEIYEILDTAKFNPAAIHLKKYHFEIVETPPNV